MRMTRTRRATLLGVLTVIAIAMLDAVAGLRTTTFSQAQLVLAPRRP